VVLPSYLLHYSIQVSGKPGHPVNQEKIVRNNLIVKKMSITWKTFARRSNYLKKGDFMVAPPCGSVTNLREKGGMRVVAIIFQNLS
jgi:hypothetical protein